MPIDDPGPAGARLGLAVFAEEDTVSAAESVVGSLLSGTVVDVAEVEVAALVGCVSADVAGWLDVTADVGGWAVGAVVPFDADVEPVLAAEVEEELASGFGSDSSDASAEPVDTGASVCSD